MSERRRVYGLTDAQRDEIADVGGKELKDAECRMALGDAGERVDARERVALWRGILAAIEGEGQRVALWRGLLAAIEGTEDR